jgi:hypothetical protein
MSCASDSIELDERLFYIPFDINIDRPPTIGRPCNGQARLPTKATLQERLYRPRARH